jgi:hypothetical protein
MNPVFSLKRACVDVKKKQPYPAAITKAEQDCAGKPVMSVIPGSDNTRCKKSVASGIVGS